MRIPRGLVVASLAAVLLAGAVGGRRLLRRSRAPRLPSERDLVKAAMAARPSDPWPRGRGHVLLAFPGTREEDKGYHEPGGSFSPGVRSFGVAIWTLRDADGRIEVSSDAIPASEITQRLEPSSDSPSSDSRDPPSIVDETGFYRVRWSTAAPGHFGAEIAPRPAGAGSLALAIRSVGPAGGPIRKLGYDRGTLRINDRWSITLTPPPTSVTVGEEPPTSGGPPPAASASPSPSRPWWTAPQTSASATGETSWQGASGWGFALLRWKQGGPGAPAMPTVTVSIADGYPVSAGPLAAYEVGTPVRARLPDERFMPSLDAQVAHLLMSLVGRESRPGDPTNYPLSWLRDGAHVVVALARAGRADVARELVRELAESDFFGGFGPEADGPGLSLWAMDEVASASHDPSFDRWLYPHAHRKAELILQMLAADRDLRREPVAGPIVPSWRQDPNLSLVCEAAKDGLIVGRMDGHRPLLFVNAVSYLGLERAAAMARRVADEPTATRYAARATVLREAWLRADHPPESDNDRTYIAALWPTWVASPQRELVRARLEDRWAKRRTPDGGYQQALDWTYFDLAEAHQWLALGEPARTAATVRYFWDNQVSAGLYTWSEGHGEENSFGLWRDVRGWVDPPHVTPHYWTAAEMLLLQLDMLAYVDDSDATPVMVIGAGIDPAWRAGPLAAANVGTRLGAVDWTWQSGVLEVKLHGPRVAVRPGSAFGPGAVVHIDTVGAGDSPPAAAARASDAAAGGPP